MIFEIFRKNIFFYFYYSKKSENFRKLYFYIIYSYIFILGNLYIYKNKIIEKLINIINKKTYI